MTQHQAQGVSQMVEHATDRFASYFANKLRPDNPQAVKITYSHHGVEGYRFHIVGDYKPKKAAEVLSVIRKKATPKQIEDVMYKLTLCTKHYFNTNEGKKNYADIMKLWVQLFTDYPIGAVEVAGDVLWSQFPCRNDFAGAVDIAKTLVDIMAESLKVKNKTDDAPSNDHEPKPNLTAVPSPNPNEQPAVEPKRVS